MRYTYVIVGFLIFLSPLFSQERVLSPQEKYNLTGFFEYVISSGGIYTILGEKPMTILDLPNPPPPILDLLLHPPSYSLFRIHKGYQIWTEFQTEILSPKFCIIKLPDYYNSFSLVLIHKEKFLKIVKANQDIFNKIYGKKVTPEYILTRFTSGKHSLDAAYKNSDLLLGILLGYGRRNAEIFQRRLDIDPFFGGQNKKPSHGFNSIEEELTHLITTYWESTTSETHSTESYPLTPIFLLKGLGFISDKKSDETVQIERRYKKAYKKALQLYNNKPFLEVTLNLLASPSN